MDNEIKQGDKVKITHPDFEELRKLFEIATNKRFSKGISGSARKEFVLITRNLFNEWLFAEGEEKNGWIKLRDSASSEMFEVNVEWVEKVI